MLTIPIHLAQPVRPQKPNSHRTKPVKLSKPNTTYAPSPPPTAIIPRIVITTEFPGGLYILTKQNGRIHIVAQNADHSKIPAYEQYLFMMKLLQSVHPMTKQLIQNSAISCKHQFVCLENFRDIQCGIIQELLLDTSVDFEHNKLGSFGYLAVRNAKPLRNLFIQKANQFPDKLMYIRTNKYNSRDRSMMYWTEIKTKFKYLLDIPGHTYSTKLYPMLFCRRLIFLVEHRNHLFSWEKLLRPYVHYIPVKNDFSNVIEQYQWAEDNPEQVAEIMQNTWSLATTQLHPTTLLDHFKNCILNKFV